MGRYKREFGYGDHSKLYQGSMVEHDVYGKLKPRYHAEPKEEASPQFKTPHYSIESFKYLEDIESNSEYSLEQRFRQVLDENAELREKINGIQGLESEDLHEASPMEYEPPDLEIEVQPYEPNIPEYTQPEAELPDVALSINELLEELEAPLEPKKREPIEPESLYSYAVNFTTFREKTRYLFGACLTYARRDEDSSEVYIDEIAEAAWKVFNELPKEYETEDVLLKIIARQLEETTIHEMLHLFGENSEPMVRKAVDALNNGT